MAVHLVLLPFLIDVTLGVWLGVMTFFPFIGAPRAFAVFGDGAAAYVNDVFPRYYRVGVGLGTLALLAGLALGSATGYDRATLALLGSVAVAMVLAGYSVQVLVPRMEATGESGFQRYHRQSVLLNGLTMLAVAGGLVASHLAV